MEIGGDHVFVDYAFVTGFPGISQSEEYFSKGSVLPDIGAASMVFKSYNRGIKQRAVQDNVADETLWFPFGRDIENPQSFDHFFIGLIILAKELISAADGKDHTVVFYIVFEIFLDFF